MLLAMSGHQDLANVTPSAPSHVCLTVNYLPFVKKTLTDDLRVQILMLI